MSTAVMLPQAAHGASDPAAGFNGVSFLGNTIEEKTRSILGWTENHTPSLSGTTNQVPTAWNRRLDRIKKSPPPKIPIRTVSNPYPITLPPSAAIQCRRVSVSSAVSSSDVVGSRLRYQLTPPPSPIFPQSGVTISSMPRQSPAYGGSNYSMQQRRYSVGSYQLPVSPVSPNTPNFDGSQPPNRRGSVSEEAFDRLKKLLPNLNTEQSKYKALLQMVTHVMDLENRLASLKEETRGLNCMLAQRRQIKQQIEQTTGVTLGSSGTAEHPSPPEPSPRQTDSPSWTEAVPDDLLNIDVSAFKTMVTNSPTKILDCNQFGEIQNSSIPNSNGRRISSGGGWNSDEIPNSNGRRISSGDWNLEEMDCDSPALFGALELTSSLASSLNPISVDTGTYIGAQQQRQVC